MTLPTKVEHYLARRAIQGPWQIDGNSRTNFLGAVVIPSLAEGDSLFHTLRSLSQNPEEWTHQFLTVVVINQQHKASEAVRKSNQFDLAQLSRFDQKLLPLAWIDACSPNLELPPKRAGVGLARKIGMDLALSRLDWSGHPLLISLDADTLVESNYLSSLIKHFATTEAGGTVLPYRHQPVACCKQQLAIDRYELFLRCYVLGLSLAKSPYAFATIGSALACKASAYIDCGGMSTRSAAEDFYFLDKLAKTAGVTPLQGTTVNPSSRVSERVPFGTGPSIAQQLANQDVSFDFYPSAPFRILGQWLALVAKHVDKTAHALWAKAQAIEPELGLFLQKSNWFHVWHKLSRNHPQADRRMKAFHCWFDGLKTLRLIHHLCATAHPKTDANLALPELFAWKGLACPTGIKEKLIMLRKLQQGE